MGVRIKVNVRLGRTCGLALALIALGCRGREGAGAAAAARRSTSAAVANLPPPVLDAREVLPAGKVPVAGEMSDPDAGDAKAAKAGGVLFSTMNCDGCHGGGATGWVGPSLVDGRWRYGSSDGNVFQSIYYGRPKGMPAYGGVLTPAMIWDLITYIKSRPLPPDVPTEAWNGAKQ